MEVFERRGAHSFTRDNRLITSSQPEPLPAVSFFSPPFRRTLPRFDAFFSLLIHVQTRRHPSAPPYRCRLCSTARPFAALPSGKTKNEKKKGKDLSRAVPVILMLIKQLPPGRSWNKSIVNGGRRVYGGGGHLPPKPPSRSRGPQL